MKKNIVVLTIVFLGCSCTIRKKNEVVQDITIGNTVTLTISYEMKFLQGKGIDSYLAYLINSKNDTFYVEYGNKRIINNLRGDTPPIFPLKQRDIIIKASGQMPSTDQVLFSEYPEEDAEQNIFDKNFFLYDTINTLVAKIVQPKKIGNGITGIYIPKLKDGNSLSIYAKNLDSINHRKALLLFETVRYKE